MRRFTSLLLMLVLLPVVTASGQRPVAGQGMVTLESTGVPAGPAHKVLMKGAIAHLQINSFDKLTSDINDLVMQFVPEEAVPQEMQAMLSEPKPLLSFIGLNTIGAPLSAEMISQMTGVDIARPVSITFYLGQTGPSYVTAIPVANFQLFTGMLANITMASSFEKTSLGTAQCFQLKPSNPKMPKNLFVVCSTDTAYLCTDPMMASQLGSSPSEARITADDFLAAFVKRFEDEDIVLALDTFMVKQFAPFAEQAFGTIPPQQIAKVRAMIPPELIPQLEMRIRMQTNFESLDECLDYVEVLLGAGYEVFAKELITLAKESRGLGLSLDIGEKYQSFTVAAHSEQIDPAKCTSPIPMAEARAALAKLPGERNIISISGREPVNGVSPATTEWIRLVRQKMAMKGLQSDTLDMFLANLAETEPPRAAETLAPWTVSTWLAGKANELPGPGLTVLELIDAMSKTSYDLPAKTSIMPIGPDVFKKHLVAEARRKSASLKREIALDKKMSDQEPFLLKDVSFKSAKVGSDGITRMTEEKSYRTRMGYFGYDEHELVSRKFTLFRQSADRLCIERGSSEPRWLADAEFGKSTAVRPSITGLLAKAPEGVNKAEIITSDGARAIMGLLAAVEDSIHFELSGYLADARRTLGGTYLDQNALAKLQSSMPMYVSSVNMDTTSREAYLVLLGDVTYPRPKVVPAVNECLEDYALKSGTVGGVACFSRTTAGVHETTVVQSSEGLALLVKTAANSFYRKYWNTPAGREAFGSLLQGPHDGTAASEVILQNPMMPVPPQPRTMR